MPCIAYHYHNELNGTVNFLGICEYPMRKEFEIKLRQLCEAMGWSPKDIRGTRCYVGTPAVTTSDINPFCLLNHGTN